MSKLETSRRWSEPIVYSSRLSDNYVYGIDLEIRPYINYQADVDVKSDNNNQDVDHDPPISQFDLERIYHLDLFEIIDQIGLTATLDTFQEIHRRFDDYFWGNASIDDLESIIDVLLAQIIRVRDRFDSYFEIDPIRSIYYGKRWNDLYVEMACGLDHEIMLLETNESSYYSFGKSQI